jgi:hypothetical protein
MTRSSAFDLLQDIDLKVVLLKFEDIPFVNYTVIANYNKHQAEFNNLALKDIHGHW